MLLQRQAKAQAEEQQAKEDAQGAPGKDTDGNSSSASDQAPGDADQPQAKAGQEQGDSASNTPPPAGNQAGDDDNLTQPPQRPVSTSLDGEQRQALEQWLREIPDNPAQLLRRKFWYEQQLHQETPR